MFVGHYGPAFATHFVRRPPSLGAAFLAVQLVDVAWAGLILAGVEHGRVEPGFLALSDLRLDHMPYTHSLPGALAFAAAGALIYRLLDRRGGWVAAGLIGACVFSHWVLDALVHAPDLELWIGGPKIGLGWWDDPVLAIGSEALVLLGGLFVYLAATTPLNATGRIAPWALMGVFAALYAVDKLGPPPANLEAMAPQALIAYVAIAGLGFLLDRTRASKARLQVQR
ncbi:MAG: hypothetical protein NW200_00800 [Hyphomonadaceae bacterium]|nr:hypothetical protein [Hyphomonadaceae bacterium]